MCTQSIIKLYLYFFNILLFYYRSGGAWHPNGEYLKQYMPLNYGPVDYDFPEHSQPTIRPQLG